MMLYLVFRIGRDRYALEAKRIVEVIPLLPLTRLPQAPRGIGGVFNYRGQPVPVVDLCELTQGHSASERLSTRIIIIHYPDRSGQPRLLGLVAEQATEILRTEPDQVVAGGLTFGTAPYLGPVLMDGQVPVQLLREQRLLSEPVRDLLFAETP